MAHPEASMAEGFLKDRCIGFIIEYLQRFDVVQRHVWDATEKYGDVEEVPKEARKLYVMTTELRDLAHQYVLSNAAIMQPLQEYVSPGPTWRLCNCGNWYLLS